MMEEMNLLEESKMNNIEKVKQQAKEVTIIYNSFLGSLSEEQQLEFRAAFHLRPTSSGTTTIVSTLPFAPMRGLPGYSPDKVKETLPLLLDILSEFDMKKQKGMLEDLNFGERNDNPREENAQAAFIRQVIKDKLGDFLFVAAEFDLFGVGEDKKTKRADVIVYRNKILYDIELKLSRNGINVEDRGDSAITQALDYSAHMKDDRYFKEYIKCLEEFPNKIGEINDIRGIAIVQATPSSRARGTLKPEALSVGVDLWTFKADENKNYEFNSNGE
jgi:hypothetical protein